MKDPIKAKIQELCPDVMEEHSVACDMDTSHGYAVTHINCTSRDLTLAVVLRAIGATGHKPIVSVSGRFYEYKYNSMVYPAEKPSARWNLEQDNYDVQSQETKDFIGTLLGVK